jgi:hypothetical protein
MPADARVHPRYLSSMPDEDLEATLLTGLCAAPERDELAITGLRLLLADVQEQIQVRDPGRD